MILYAQNAEDVVLMRAFADVVSGFYVDVGAWDPTAESVTKVFYDSGGAHCMDGYITAREAQLQARLQAVEKELGQAREALVAARESNSSSVTMR